MRGDVEDGSKECERLREGSQGKCWIITDLMYIYSFD